MIWFLIFGIVVVLISIWLLCWKRQKKKKLCLLAIFKNETMNLDVWIRHYVSQGVETFYLIDNGSTDDPMSILKPYINRGLVKYFYRPQKHQQIRHYHDIIRSENILNKTTWLLICDLDEFVFSTSATLSSTLDSYEAYDIVYSQWRVFGSDGHLDHPPDIRVAMVHRHPDLSSQTKYIVRTSSIQNIEDLGVHFAKNIPNAIVENDTIRIHHYPIQSWQYFYIVKRTRGDVASEAADSIRDEHYFDNYNKIATLKDTTLHDLVLLHGDK